MTHPPRLRFCLLCCAIWLVVGACDELPTATRPATQDEARAVLSFGAALEDADVIAFAREYGLTVDASYLRAGEFTGVYRAHDAVSPERTLRDARHTAREIATFNEQESREIAQALLEDAVADPRLAAHAREQARSLASQESALESVQSGGPLVWGLEVRGTRAHVEAAGRDTRVQEFSFAEWLDGRTTAFRALTPPPVAGVPVEGRRLSREQGQLLALSAATVSAAAAAPTQPPRNYPNRGSVTYNGSYTVRSDFVFDNPGGWHNSTPGYEHDLEFRYGLLTFIIRGCISWTNLPDPYDDCATMGVDEEDPDYWVASFGTYAAKSIEAGRVYTGTLAFLRPSVRDAGEFTVRGQEVYLDPKCIIPVRTIWCMFGAQTIPLVSGQFTHGQKSAFTWRILTPAVFGVSPNPAAASGQEQVLTLTGRDFLPGARVDFVVGGRTYPVTAPQVTVVNSSQIRAIVNLGTTRATWTATVMNPGFVRSGPYSFEVSSPDRPAPLITGVTPAIVPAIAGEQTISLRGNRFETNAYVILRVGANTYRVMPPLARVVSPYQLDVKVQLGTTPAAWSAQVVNPGGVLSNRYAFNVSNEQPPVIGAVLPNPVPALGEPQTIIIGGSRFQTGTTLVMKVNGSTYRIGPPEVTVVTASRIEARVNLGTEPAQWSVQAVNAGGMTSGPFNFSVGGATPAIARLSPNPVPATGVEQVLTLHGSSFMSRASLVMRVNGNTYTLGPTHVTVVNPTQIQARVNLGTAPATWSAQVVNPGSLRSEQYAFDVVTQAPPTLTRVSPNPVPASAAEQTLTLSGSGFREGASLVMRVNGTTYRVGAAHVTVVGASQLLARVTLGTTPATWSAQVVNPDGLVSEQFSFPVVSEGAPALSGVSPDPVPALGAEQLVRFSGSGFVPGATMVMRVNGNAYRIGAPEVTVVSPSRIDARVNLGVTPATWSAQVFNPTGVSSGVLPFSVVRAPAPSASAVAPNPAPAISGEQTISISGSNFLTGAELVFRVSGNTYRVTAPHVTVVSASRIDARVTLGTVPADWSVQVVNTDGQASGTAGFRVGARAPGISGVSPAPVSAIPAEQTLDIYGSGFVSGAELVFRVSGNTYRVGGPEVTVQSASHIRARVTLGTTPATWTVQVANPDGQSSGQLAFSVMEPVPGIGSVSPHPVPATGVPQVISFFGSGFNPGAVVVFRVNGNEYRISAPDITVVSATRIDARVNLGTTPATWSAQVVNRYGTFSNVFGFSVQ